MRNEAVRDRLGFESGLDAWDVTAKTREILDVQYLTSIINASKGASRGSIYSRTVLRKVPAIVCFCCFDKSTIIGNL